MATPLETLQKKAGTLEGTIRGSSTAYAPNTLPTSSDLSRSSQLAAVNKQIDTLKSTQLRNRWYGSADVPAEETGSSDGMLMTGLKTLTKPLNLIAGGAQYALGKGTKGSITANMDEAMRSGLQFGNILQQFGVPRGVQIPLGFALDVAFDPVTWATMGSSALIPRIGLGAVKGATKTGIRGALEGAGLGLASNLEKKAATAMNLVPFAKSSIKYKNLAKTMSEKAIAGAEKYNTLVGKDVYESLGKGIMSPILERAGIEAGQMYKGAENVLRGKTAVPGLGALARKTATGETVGDKIVDFLKYSPQQAARQADVMDEVKNLAAQKGITLERNVDKVDFKTIADVERPGATVTRAAEVKKGLDKAVQQADQIIQVRDKTGGLNKLLPGPVKVHDTLENARTLLGVAADDEKIKLLTNAYKITDPGKSGFQWYDNAINKLKNTTVDDAIHLRLGPIKSPVEAAEKVQMEAKDLIKNWNSYSTYKDLKPLEKVLKAYPIYISVFKAAKVPMSVSSHVVATLGNLFMGAMEGLPVWKPAYIREVWKANKFLRGKLSPAEFKEMIMGDVNSLMEMSIKNPTRFRQMGLDPGEIATKLGTAETIRLALKGTTPEKVVQLFKKEFEALEAGLKQGETLAKIESKATGEAMGRFSVGAETASKMAKEAPLRQAETAGSWISGELGAFNQNNVIDKLKDRLAVLAKNNPYRPEVRALNTLINSLPRWYEQIDQSWKLGTVNYLSKVGLTEQELKLVSRSVPMTKADIFEEAVGVGEKLYKVTPLKASEVAMETFMNYSAMPDFVKLMRSIPIAGFPFISFPYAMAAKMGKTAVNNPALFNKVGFLINEMNAGRTPQEKAAMETKYNQYLKAPTVVKMFGMWNTNVKNYIPYYTMNIFNPSERTYGNTVPEQMLKMFDKLPVFQDPVGQVIKDYWIQPWVLSGSGTVPQGQFGQPLFPGYDEAGKPIKASFGTKAFYAGRTLAETAVPGSLGYLGFLGGALPQGAIEALPSYRARAAAYSEQGRSSIGATTKEDAVRKTLRALLGTSGIPAYTLDTTKTTIKK